MPNDAFWERNLLHEQQRAQADAHARSDSGTESDDNLPIASTLATKTNEKIVPHAAGLDGAMPRPKGLKKKKATPEMGIRPRHSGPRNRLPVLGHPPLFCTSSAGRWQCQAASVH